MGKHDQSVACLRDRPPPAIRRVLQLRHDLHMRCAAPRCDGTRPSSILQTREQRFIIFRVGGSVGAAGKGKDSGEADEGKDIGKAGGGEGEGPDFYGRGPDFYATFHGKGKYAPSCKGSGWEYFGNGGSCGPPYLLDKDQARLARWHCAPLIRRNVAGEGIRCETSPQSNIARSPSYARRREVLRDPRRID